MSWATLADLEARHPAELITLAAHEQTGIRDDERVERAIEDASAECRAILKARYSAAELARLDAESLGTLRLYTMDVALYRISLSFARTSEAIGERYKAAIRRLEAISTGKAALTLTAPPREPGAEGEDKSERPTVSPNEVIVEAPERMFTRERMRGY